MKFGLYSSIASPPRGEHIDRCIDEVITEAQLAESCGFDSCFFGEHHQDTDGFLPSPLIVATAVAARTRTLRVGTSVILLPLHHPVHLAEDATALATVYKDAAREAGRPAHVVQMRDAWVASTRAEAEAVYGPHVMAAYKYYWDNKLAEFRSIPAGTPFTLENLAPDRLVLGEPEACVREFHPWQKATGAETFLLRFRPPPPGGPPHQKNMEAAQLFRGRPVPPCR